MALVLKTIPTFESQCQQMQELYFKTSRETKPFKNGASTLQSGLGVAEWLQNGRKHACPRSSFYSFFFWDNGIKF